MTPDLSHLHGRTRLECVRPGFEDIEPGDMLDLLTHSEDMTRSSGGLVNTRRIRVITLTTSGGTVHHFHAREDDARLAGIRDRQPVANPFVPERVTPIVKHHPISSFVAHFHLPTAPGTSACQPPADQSMLDLVEAILGATQSVAP